MDVFRRSEFLPEVARDFLAGQAKVFWAQLGLESQEAETILRSAGKEAIVMNRCLKIDYLKWIANQS
ncbi:coA binding domain-containing protein [Streptococcus equi subsp. equi]|nr:coA binding domain-containing protein [Streptococcus equi subsp. equi]